jgi:hypothetical protein
MPTPITPGGGFVTPTPPEPDPVEPEPADASAPAAGAAAIRLPPPDPKPLAVHGTDAFRLEGPAFRDGPQFDDVDQGKLGDCWLLSGMSAVAHTDPELIERLIQDNGDGTYNVTFYEKTKDPVTGALHFAPHTEVVVPRFYGLFGLHLYADPSPKGESEIWAALLEKGYAQWKGADEGFKAIVGGHSHTAFEVLTGKRANYYSLKSDTSLDGIWATLKSAHDADRPLGIGTRTEKTGGIVPADGLESGHAYAILDVYERDGERYVKVYNPHGPDDRGLDRTHELTIAQVRANFDCAYEATC